MIGGKKIIHRAIALAATGLALGGCASFADTPPQRITPLSGARIGVITFPGTLDDVDALRAVHHLGLPDCWVGAGFVRALVWDHLHGYNEATPLDDVDLILRNGLPVVLIARSIPRASLPVFRGDDAFGTGLATKHLISLGHKRIAFFAGPRFSARAVSRQEGYRRALRENNIDEDPGLVFNAGMTIAEGAKAAEHFLEEQTKATAVQTVNDLVAIGADVGDLL